MARPERPIISDDPALAGFARGLRDLRISANLTLTEVARRAHYSASALSDATSGRRLPTWNLTRAMVEACGGDVEEWRRRWLAISEGDQARLRELLSDEEPLTAKSDILVDQVSVSFSDKIAITAKMGKDGWSPLVIASSLLIMLLGLTLPGLAIAIVLIGAHATSLQVAAAILSSQVAGMGFLTTLLRWVVRDRLRRDRRTAPRGE